MPEPTDAQVTAACEAYVARIRESEAPHIYGYAASLSAMRAALIAYEAVRDAPPLTDPANLEWWSQQPRAVKVHDTEPLPDQCPALGVIGPHVRVNGRCIYCRDQLEPLPEASDRDPKGSQKSG